MVIARIRGGLGNQLFQYAAARALAWHNDVPLKLDLYTYSKNKYRKYELDQLNIDATIASREEVHQFTGRNPLIRYLNKRENYLRCPSVLAQPHYHFFEDFFSVNVPVYLSGYWNSFKYFAPYKKEIINQFTMRDSPPKSFLRWKQKIESGESVAIHIRRGDYVSNQAFHSFFGALPLAYYRKAVNEILMKAPSSKFYVFSDDLEWCKKNLEFLSNAEFVAHETSVTAFTDLLLMAQCQHQIIANSTYSWWGAWLNNNANKIVVAPEQWFAKKFNDAPETPYATRYYNTKDLLPESWIKL
jgi:hypothetical protein